MDLKCCTKVFSISIFLHVCFCTHGKILKSPSKNQKSLKMAGNDYIITFTNSEGLNAKWNDKGLQILVKRKYRIGRFLAALVEADDEALDVMRNDPRVLKIEPNYVIDMYGGLADSIMSKKLYNRKASFSPETHKEATHSKKAHNDVVHKQPGNGEGTRKYIIRVKGGKTDVKALRKGLKQMAFTLPPGQKIEIVRELHIHRWHGMIVKMDEKIAERVKANPYVSIMEVEQEVRATTTSATLPESDFVKYGTITVAGEEKPVSETVMGDITTYFVPVCQSQATGELFWGLSRISTRDRPTYNVAEYRYSAEQSGQGIDIYVLDSGVNTEHEDFEGRASLGMTASGIEDEGDADLYGQGTHVASIVAGKTYGVAKHANVISVKVLNSNGTGSIADIFEGIEWSVNQIQSKGKVGRSAVNLSLGKFGISSVLERAVQSGLDAGIPIVMAAGDGGRDTCSFTPGRVSGGITVGASTEDDLLAAFSNFGPCVDIIAPGQNIIGASNKDTTGTAIYNGTSSAVPHVAGAVANYLSSLSSDTIPSAADVKQYILDQASVGFIYFDEGDRATPNRLLYISCNNTSAGPIDSSASSGQCLQQTTGDELWSLTRVSSRESNVNYDEGYYNYSEDDDGNEVDIYIVDTGVYIDHREFEDRASWGMTAKDLSDEGDKDLNGHGTHVASLAAGRTYGTAKKAKIIAVKVLDRNSVGSSSTLLDGLAWVSEEIESKKGETQPPKGAAINLSLGSRHPMIAVEEAIHEIIAAGTPVIVAAGNDKGDACFESPARMSSVITVAATNQSDNLASFSNYGSCVDILAPGEKIKGAFIDDLLASYSGTSQAAPHVTGVTARYLSSFSAEETSPSPEECKAHQVDTATVGVVNMGDGEKESTPNLLCYAGCNSDDSGTSQIQQTHYLLFVCNLIVMFGILGEADY